MSPDGGPPMKRRLALLAPLLLLAAGGVARADLIFTANLTHDQETPPPGQSLQPPLTSTGDPRPLSFGTATFTLNGAETQLSMSVTISNIDVTGVQTPDTFDNLVNAHIH